MKAEIPSGAEVRALLAPLGHAATQRLAALSGVPFGTIWNVREGHTKNPGVDTVRRFLPHIEAAQVAPSEAVTG
jgi:hypothetical protein